MNTKYILTGGIQDCSYFKIGNNNASYIETIDIGIYALQIYTLRKQRTESLLHKKNQYSFIQRRRCVHLYIQINTTGKQ